MEIVTIVALIILIGIREYFHQMQVKDLMKGLLSKNLTDYTTSAIMEKEDDKADEKLQKLIAEEEDTRPLESATDDEFMEAIKQDVS